MKAATAPISPRTWWALGYAAINLIAAGIVVSSGELLGDLAGEQPRQMSAFLVTAIVLCGSIGALLLFFNAATRIDLGLRPLEHDRERLGLMLAIAQCGFIVYVQQTGLFIAGSAERGGSAASAFWVLLNIDALFMIYWGSCRESRYFKINLLLWTFSFMQRGWFAYLFFLVALESFRVIRKQQISWGKLLLVFSLVLAYPVLDLLKVYVRISDVITPVQAMSFVGDGLASADFRWADSLLNSAERIVARIQVVSHAQVIADNASYFQRQVATGGIAPFWREGVLGIIWDRQLGNVHPPESSQALASFIAPSLDSSWNVNPSMTGWLTMHAEQLPLALLYLSLLCAASIVLAQLIEQRTAFRDVIWFIWLVFLLPGWIAQFVSFVLALATYLVLAAITRLRWLPEPVATPPARSLRDVG
jgi:hypothetical protein